MQDHTQRTKTLFFCAQKVADSCKGIYAKETVILPFDLEARGDLLREIARTALSVNSNRGPDYVILNAGSLIAFVRNLSWFQFITVPLENLHVILLCCNEHQS